MEDLLTKLFESAKKNRKAFNLLKKCAVACQQYKITADLIEIEKELFSETDEIKLARKKARDLQYAFAMVGLTVDESHCFLVDETMRVYNERKAGFSLEDSTILIEKTKELYPNE